MPDSDFGYRVSRRFRLRRGGTRRVPNTDNTCLLCCYYYYYYYPWCREDENESYKHLLSLKLNNGEQFHFTRYWLKRVAGESSSRWARPVSVTTIHPYRFDDFTCWEPSSIRQQSTGEKGGEL